MLNKIELYVIAALSALILFAAIGEEQEIRGIIANIAGFTLGVCVFKLFFHHAWDSVSSSLNKV